MPKFAADSFPGLEELTQLFKTLADGHRLKILYLLYRHGEMNVSALSDELGQTQPAVSHHLLQLKAAGLVEYRREGKYNHYSLGTEELRRTFDHIAGDASSVKVVLGGVEITVKPRR